MPTISGTPPGLFRLSGNTRAQSGAFPAGNALFHLCITARGHGILYAEVIVVKKKTWKVYVFWLVITQAVGGLAALLTRDAVRIYGEQITKPPLSPPAVVFPVAWILLYTLMAVGAARVTLAAGGRQKTACLRLYLIQLAFNFFWSILFFRFQAFALALVWLAVLWALIARMAVCFNKVDRPAALLQIPYLLWVAFAGYLNAGVFWLNR